MISLSSTGNSAPEDETAGAESISPKRLIRIYRVLAIQDKLISDPILVD